MRAALLGMTAAVIAAGYYWLVLTRPLALAMVLDRTF